jgi:AAA family ATP:ADP antiporter
MASSSLAPPAPPKSWLDRLLSVAAEVHGGEAVTALLLASNVFLLLCAYYIIRPVREALILPVPGGAEIKSYAGALHAGLFLFIVPAYGAFASKVNRIRLINAVTLFFASNLVLFFLVGQIGLPPTLLAVCFFLWVGIFNLMVIAQFWSFANDLYTEEQGKRLFAIVGVGSSVGAVAGSQLAGMLIDPLGLFGMMLVAAGILVLCLLLTNVVHFREKGRAAGGVKKQEADRPLGRDGGFQLVLQHRYLLLIGLLTLLINVVNTNGEYMLGRTFSEVAGQTVAAGRAGGLSQGELIGSYYADFQFWQNLLGALIQLFLVSRIFKYLGVRAALFIMPMISLFGYTLFAAAPIFAYIRIAKILENATDYSLQNTVRRALFLPTSREAKYKALQAVETFFWRAGDMISGVLVFAGIRLLQLGAVATINIGLVAVWLLLAWGIAREYRKMAAKAALAEEAA